LDDAAILAKGAYEIVLKQLQ